MNVIAKVKEKANNGIVKCMAVAVPVVYGFEQMALTAFAENSDVIETVTTSMTTQLTSLVSKAGTAIAGIVGVGLVIFGVKWLVGILKGFFRKLAS